MLTATTLLSFTEFMEQVDLIDVFSNELVDIETDIKLEDTIEKMHEDLRKKGMQLVNIAKRYDVYTSGEKFSDWSAIAYAQSYRLKGLDKYIDEYIEYKKEYLKAASTMRNLNGWLCSVELAMLNKEDIPESILNEYIERITEWIK